MVNLELYRVFCTVAKCGSLTKAAEELFISQPAVSQAIKQLENQLGGALFNRTHKGMELSNEGGKQIFTEVEKAIKILDNAENVFSKLQNTAVGSLKICASDTVCRHFLMKYIKAYHENFPNVKLSLTNCTSKETIEQIKSKRADLGLVNLPLYDNDVLLSDTVMHLNDVFVANSTYSHLKDKNLSLKQLEEFPLLMLELKTSTRRSIVDFAHAQGVHLHPEVEVASIELMLDLAKIGLGIACVPREFVLDELKSGELFELKVNPAFPSRAIGLVIQKDGSTNYITKEFLKILN